MSKVSTGVSISSCYFISAIRDRARIGYANVTVTWIYRLGGDVRASRNELKQLDRTQLIIRLINETLIANSALNYLALSNRSDYSEINGEAWKVRQHAMEMARRGTSAHWCATPMPVMPVIG